jgi:hypothetical protein
MPHLSNVYLINFINKIKNEYPDLNTDILRNIIDTKIDPEISVEEEVELVKVFDVHEEVERFFPEPFFFH